MVSCLSASVNRKEYGETMQNMTILWKKFWGKWYLQNQHKIYEEFFITITHRIGKSRLIYQSMVLKCFSLVWNGSTSHIAIQHTDMQWNYFWLKDKFVWLRHCSLSSLFELHYPKLSTFLCYNYLKISWREE